MTVDVHSGAHTHDHAAVENPHAGKGSSVLLDIGGDVGAIVIEMPADLVGTEIELHSSDRPGAGHAPHVEVVPRPAADGTLIPSAVFFEVSAGRYHFRVLPGGPPQLEVEVTGGHVVHASWPGLPVG